MTVYAHSFPYQVVLTTTNQVIPVGDQFLEDSHLEVTQTDTDGVDTVLTLGTHYTVTDAGEPAGGSITMIGGTVGYQISIARNVPLTQEQDYVENDRFDTEDVERAHDKGVMQVQQLSEIQGRTLKAPVSDPSGADMTLPTKTNRASKIAAYDEDGKPTALEVSDLVTTAAVIDDDTLGGGSASTTDAASQSSTKNYVDTELASAVDGINSSQFKNLMPNGDLSIAQEQTTVDITSSTGEYVCDMVRVSIDEYSAGTLTVSQEDIVDTDTGSPSNVTKFLRVTSDATFELATSGNVYGQHEIYLENIRRFKGKDITISFPARGSSGTKLGVHASANFGSGGSASVESKDFDTDQVKQHVSLNTDWTEYTHTISIPEFDDKTFGSDNTSHLVIALNFATDDTVTTDSGYDADVIFPQSATLDIAKIQVEYGDTKTEFEIPDNSFKLQTCQRYYQTSEIVGSYVNTTGIGSMLLPVNMRVTPTVSYTDSVGNDTKVSIDSVDNIAVTSGEILVTSDRVIMELDTATVKTSSWCRAVYTLDARF